MMAKDSPVHKILKGQCPSCDYIGDFKYIGSQKWPDDVAARLGISETIALYQCENCLTTISEPMLKGAS